MRSKRRQTVNIPAAELTLEFQEGETIWTESSHKYSPQEVFQMALTTGFRCEVQWIDEQWPFAENLLDRGMKSPAQVFLALVARSR